MEPTIINNFNAIKPEKDKLLQFPRNIGNENHKIEEAFDVEKSLFI